MPYKDREKQRQFQRNWKQKRRQEWLDQNGPCVQCGSNQDLEVDHKERNAKVDHKVWSWAEDRRNTELAKCQVLCEKCHKKKTALESWRPIPHGTSSGYRRHCRCVKCAKAHSIDMKSYHKINPR